MGNSNGGIMKILRGPYPNPVPEPKSMLRRFELLPLFALLIADTIVTTSVLVWMYNTRDIVIDRSKLPINEQMDLLKPYHLKLMVIDEVWEPAVDLHAAYEAMREEQQRRDEEK